MICGIILPRDIFTARAVRNRHAYRHADTSDSRSEEERIIMRHYIIAKWNEGVDKQAVLAPVKEIFDRTLEIPGIHAVRVIPCCIDRPNRYDVMIEIEMDPEALPAYDVSAPHKAWKEQYGSLLAAKTIFDRED